MVRIAIFASGNGTNAEQLILYFKNNSFVKPVLVVSNRRHAFVLERAKKLNVPNYWADKEILDDNMKMLNLLLAHEIDFIVLAGYLKLIPSALIEAFPNRIVNLHPALLPKFGGKGMYGNNVHKAVLAAGENESGITVHYVNKHYDEGQIIAQFKCPVFPGDTCEQLANRIHKLEHKYYPVVCDEIIRKEFDL